MDEAVLRSVGALPASVYSPPPRPANGQTPGDGREAGPPGSAGEPGELEAAEAAGRRAVAEEGDVMSLTLRSTKRDGGSCQRRPRTQRPSGMTDEPGSASPAASRGGTLARTRPSAPPLAASAQDTAMGEDSHSDTPRSLPPCLREEGAFLHPPSPATPLAQCILRKYTEEKRRYDKHAAEQAAAEEAAAKQAAEEAQEQEEEGMPEAFVRVWATGEERRTATTSRERLHMQR